MRILLVEDDHVSSIVLERLVQSAGHETVLAVNGKEALDKYMAEPFSLILSDWMMPEMDGLEFCRRVKEFASNIDHPCYFIMVTAKGQHSDIVEALSVGTDDFITKPVDKNVLLIRIAVAERLLGELDVDTVLSETPSSFLHNQHDTISEALDTVENAAESMGEVESFEVLSEILMHSKEGLYDNRHKEQEDVYIGAFLDSMISSGDEWLGEISSSSFAMWEEEHADLQETFADMRNAILAHIEHTNTSAHELCQGCVLTDESKDKKFNSELFLESCISDLQKRLGVVSHSRERLQALLKRYVAEVREHIALEEKTLFPFARKYLTVEDEKSILESCRSIMENGETPLPSGQKAPNRIAQSL